MLRLVSEQLEVATTSSEHALSAEKAFFAIAQFAAQMDETDMKPYIDDGMKIIRSFMNHPGQKRNVRY